MFVIPVVVVFVFGAEMFLYVVRPLVDLVAKSHTKTILGNLVKKAKQQKNLSFLIFGRSLTVLLPN